MLVLPLPLVQGEEEGVVGIVGVEEIHPAQVELIIPGDNSKEGVQEVVALVDEDGIHGGEDFGERGMA